MCSYCVLAVSTGAEAASHTWGDVGDATVWAHRVPLLRRTRAASVALWEERSAVGWHSWCPGGQSDMLNLIRTHEHAFGGCESCEKEHVWHSTWFAAHHYIRLMLQHWPIVWNGEPSHRNVVTFHAKLKQLKEIRQEGRSKEELSTWHHAQFVPLHQHPSQEDPYCHYWQVQHT